MKLIKIVMSYRTRRAKHTKTTGRKVWLRHDSMERRETHWCVFAFARSTRAWRWAFWKCNHFHANKIREAFHFGEVVKAPINNNSQAIWEFCCFHSITLPSIARLGRRCNESFFNCTIFASPLTCEHSSNTHFSGCWNFSHCFTWNGFLCKKENPTPGCKLRAEVVKLRIFFFFHHPSEVHKLIHDGT